MYDDEWDEAMDFEWMRAHPDHDADAADLHPARPIGLADHEIYPRRYAVARD